MFQLRVANFLPAYRQSTYGKATINLSELKKWCDEHKKIPNNEGELFVSDFFSQR